MPSFVRSAPAERPPVAVVYLKDSLGRATLAFDILLGLIHFAILVRLAA